LQSADAPRLQGKRVLHVCFHLSFALAARIGRTALFLTPRQLRDSPQSLSWRAMERRKAHFKKTQKRGIFVIRQNAPKIADSVENAPKRAKNVIEKT
jgi:hypothetical protein